MMVPKIEHASLCVRPIKVHSRHDGDRAEEAAQGLSFAALVDAFQDRLNDWRVLDRDGGAARAPQVFLGQQSVNGALFEGVRSKTERPRKQLGGGSGSGS
jgi:hypothetical protein